MHSYLETRWRFGTEGCVLEQLAANQARVIMTVDAFCCDVALRLRQVADSSPDEREEFYLPGHLLEVLQRMKGVFLIRALSETTVGSSADVNDKTSRLCDDLTECLKGCMMGSILSSVSPSRSGSEEEDIIAGSSSKHSACDRLARIVGVGGGLRSGQR